MTDEEAFHGFLFGVQPHLQDNVGAHVQGDLQAAFAMAQHLEVYHGGDGAKASGKGPKKFQNQNQKKNVIVQVEGSSSRGTAQVVQVVKKLQQKKGQGRFGKWWKEDQEGRLQAGSMPQLWWQPFLAGLQGMERS